MARKPARKSSAKRSQVAVVPHKDWTLQVLVPRSAPGEDDLVGGSQTELHSKGVVGWLFGSAESVPASEVAEQWKDTISGIVSTVGEWTATQSNKWRIEEVTFGLTLSAKGQLLFIAEASAQGSVQVKLTRAGA